MFSQCVRGLRWNWKYYRNQNGTKTKTQKQTKPKEMWMQGAQEDRKTSWRDQSTVCIYSCQGENEEKPTPRLGEHHVC